MHPAAKTTAVPTMLTTVTQPVCACALVFNRLVCGVWSTASGRQWGSFSVRAKGTKTQERDTEN
jgi:hypothetical protein